jgi:hypothetical protein
MRRATAHLFALSLLVGASLAFAATPPKPAPAARRTGPRVATMSFVIGHRVFTQFRDQVTVRMQETFRVGDSEYSAKVVEFQPDFTMDLETRRVGSRSSEPDNPAVRVIVWRNGAPDDTAWAFLNMPPHFARHSMLAFRLTRLTFEDHAPLEARVDSTARAKGTGH